MLSPHHAPAPPIQAQSEYNALYTHVHIPVAGGSKHQPKHTSKITAVS